MKIRNRTDLKHAIENVRSRYPTEIVRLELYRLACCFHASKALRDLSDGSDYCPYQPLRDEYEQSEIARVLLVLGSAGRLACGHAKRVGCGSVIDLNIVGSVQDDVKKGKVRPLNVLEVCSKFLHAQLVLPQVRYQGNPYRAYLRPRITLFSDSSCKVGWKATVDVNRLVAAFSNILA